MWTQGCRYAERSSASPRMWIRGAKLREPKDVDTRSEAPRARGCRYAERSSASPRMWIRGAKLRKPKDVYTRSEAPQAFESSDKDFEMNPLEHLIDYGQSFWLDNIRRGFTRAGSLMDLVTNDGLRGVTSNPSIFEKSVADGEDYDDAIRELAAAGKTPEQMYDVLTTDDIREACDVFEGLFEQSKGGDGFVSIELPPHLANDADGSITEGLRLWPLVDRPNVMIKVPATDAGMPVIRRLISEGVNVNITL